jgi:phosphoribosylanthranilate isomerase
MARVKICGINSPAAMDAACRAGADWVGFVFAAGSPRWVSGEMAAALSARQPGGPLRVGLFVEPDEAAIDAVLEEIPLDVLQIYAPVERVAELRSVFGVTTWRGVGLREAADLPALGEAVDGYVLEAAAPRGAALPGGNGCGFDHGLLAGWTAPRPWLLAGGLSVETVAGAIAASGAEAVDVSSGVESARGVKDADLIARFIAAVKLAES